MKKLMGDEGWGGGGLYFSTDPKCLWDKLGLHDSHVELCSVVDEWPRFKLGQVYYVLLLL